MGKKKRDVVKEIEKEVLPVDMVDADLASGPGDVSITGEDDQDVCRDEVLVKEE